MFFLSPILFVLILLSLFYFISFYMPENLNQMSIFECGYKSYFFSRFSFSVQFFFISMIFLFLDLEICITILILLENLSIFFLNYVLVFFLNFLLFSLYLEWLEEKLDWIN